VFPGRFLPVHSKLFDFHLSAFQWNHLDQSTFLGPLLKNKLSSLLKSDNLEVLNAEISDPAYGLYYLQKFGVHYEPDIVLLGLCGNDFVQAYSFAGPDQRFHIVDGELKLNQEYHNFVNPIIKFKEYKYKANNHRLQGTENQHQSKTSFITLYSLKGFQYLSIIRDLKETLNIPAINNPRHYEIINSEENFNDGIPLIDGFPNIGFYLKNTTKPIEEMYKTSFELFQLFKKTCDESNAEFVLVYFPTPFEVIPSEWESLCKNWGLNPADFDLKKHSNRISYFAESNDIIFIDTTEKLIASHTNEALFIPLNAHFTEQTHQIIANQLAEELLLLLQ